MFIHVQVEEFGGDRRLRDVLPEIRDQGSIGVECLVMTAWKINQDGKEFTHLLQVTRPSAVARHLMHAHCAALISGLKAIRSKLLAYRSTTWRGFPWQSPAALSTTCQARPPQAMAAPLNSMHWRLKGRSAMPSPLQVPLPLQLAPPKDCWYQPMLIITKWSCWQIITRGAWWCEVPKSSPLLRAGSAVKVLFINCQSGHDSMHMRGQADDMAELLTLLPGKFPGMASLLSHLRLPHSWKRVTSNASYYSGSQRSCNACRGHHRS